SLSTCRHAHLPPLLSSPTRRSSDLAYDWLCHVYLRCNSSLRNEDRYRASGWSDKPSRIPVEGTRSARERCKARGSVGRETEVRSDRKSTRLNSSHVKISYAVFCLKK